jgi:FkbM family methyltransferase
MAVGKSLRALLMHKAIRRQWNLFKIFSNWWIYYAAKIGLAQRESMLFFTRRGVSIEVPRRLYPEFKSIFLRQHYLEGLVLPLRKQPIVVDIGANVGFFSLFAASEWGAEVFAYEPLQANYEELLRNVRRNPHLRINCRRMAVFGVPGPVIIYRDPATSLAADATLYPSRQKTKGEEVEAVTLKDIFEREGLAEVDLVKMDCEGSEFSILSGSDREVLARIGQMAVEVHPDLALGDHNADGLKEFLSGVGFIVETDDEGSYLWARRKDGHKE